MAAPGGHENVIAIGAALDAPADAPKLADAGDAAPMGAHDHDDTLDRPLLPAGCPVKALGMKGQTCWYLDVQGQLIALNPRDHGKNNILSLFSPLTHLPPNYWPRWSAPKVDRKTGQVIEPSKLVGFAQDDASEALISACGKSGIFDVRGKVRGRGSHGGRDGALVLHLGDKIMSTQRRVDGSAGVPFWHDPGLIGGYVYPADAPAPRPAPEPAGEDAGEQLYHVLSTWNWARPGLDPMLALGWAGQGFIGGALSWRSHLFITGGRGTGKSTLNGKDGVFDRLFGKGALRTGNASEAAVRQLLGAMTIPVIFDEFEASELNPHKTKAVVELARVASSGAEMHRGGQDHNAHEFVLKSAFQFSAILMPELQPQDRSRFAILELKPFAAGTPEINLDKLKLDTLGRRLQRRMVDGWPRLAETLHRYREALGDVGHSSRGRDTFGTLLACADLLLYDHLPDPALCREWAGKCDPGALAELIDAADEHEACLTRLATFAVQSRGGDERLPLSAWITLAATDPASSARDRLQTHGLRLVNLRSTKGGALGAVEHKLGDPGFLAVASDHEGLSAIFRGSRWQSGAWTQALNRVPGAERGIKVKFAGRSLRTVCVPIEAVIDLPTGAEGGE